MSQPNVPNTIWPAWLSALSEPATWPAEDTPDYADNLARLRELMGQHSAPQGHAVPWPQVAERAISLLHHDKDLKVIAYLLLARAHLGGVQDAALGLRGLAVLVRDHWHNLTPPISRLRGRMAALAWLHEELLQLLQLQKAIGAADADDLQAAAQQLDEALAAHTESQGMQFLQMARQLPERAPVPASAAPAPAPAVQSPKVASHIVSHGYAMPPITELGTWGAQLLQAADAGAADDALSESALRLRRQGLWLHITRAPAATAPEGSSTIPPLAPQDVQQLRDLEAQGLWAELLRVSEALMPRNRLQLCLQRLSAQALVHLGTAGQAASRAVAAETLSLVVRLPELCRTRASDGAQLLDDATRTWLTQAVPDALQAVSTQPAPAPTANTPNPRSQLLEQLRRAEAWQGAPEVAHAALYALSRGAHAHKLEHWEPALAMQVFSAELRALHNLPPLPKRQARISRLMGRIAALDLRHAHSLDPTQTSQGA